MNEPINLNSFRLDSLFTELGLQDDDKIGREVVSFLYHMHLDNAAPTGKATAHSVASEKTLNELRFRTALFHAYHEDFFQAINEDSETDPMYIAALCAESTPLLHTREIGDDGVERPQYPMDIDTRDTGAATSFWGEAISLMRDPIREPVSEYYTEALFVAHVQASVELEYALTAFNQHSKEEHRDFNRDIVPLIEGFIVPQSRIGQQIKQQINRFRSALDNTFGRADVVSLFDPPEQNA